MATPLFILSFRHRDELARLAEGAGWQPIAARRADNAEARFVACGAAVALVDARGALAEGREAVRAIADAAEANEAALVVLLSRTDAAALDSLHQCGATHFLVSPFSEAQLLHTLRFAERHAERVGGAARLQRRSGAGGSEGSSWRWAKGAREVELGPALARKAGLDEAAGGRMPVRALLRRLGAEGRTAAIAAVRRAAATGEPTAFAHADSEREGARIAHHVRLAEDGGLSGRAETLPEGEARRFASRDPLTGLADGRAARAWLAGRLGEGGAVALLVSVTRYDAINAAFGRSTGDSVLQAVARRVERLVEADTRRRLVARLAGAEFAVLLAAPALAQDARFLAERLVEAIGRPFVSGDHVVALAARAGIAAGAAGEEPAALLRRASAALASARSGEGAPVRMADDDASEDMARHDRLEVDLRRALDRDEIEILFQPQVSVATGEIVGAEALARWNHGEQGALGASTLFSVAERSDYLVQLSDHVQRKAIAAAAAWPDALKALRLSLNITAADIVRPGFAESFLELVRSSGFEPGRLTVEVTENGLIEDLGAAAALLAHLRGGGLRVAIDDFGTGYSSLAYLKALPLDYLKIDKRLSEDIVGSPRDRVVVRGVIDMARSLGLEVIAEGVESEAQLGLLAQEGCTLYQGYLCAPPVPAEALAALVRG